MHPLSKWMNQIINMCYNLCLGVSIKVWDGKDLEDLTFEEVKSFLMRFVDSGQEEVEIVMKECR